MSVAEPSRVLDCGDPGTGSSDARPGGTLGPLGEPGVAAYLRMLRAHLPGSVGAELTSTHARGSFDMAMSLLDHLIIRDGRLADALAERQQHERRAWEALDPSAPMPPSARPPHAALEASLVEAIGACRSPVTGRGAAPRQAMCGLIGSELQFLRQIGRSEAAVAEAEVPPDADGIKAERIEAYLQSHAFDGLPLSVTEIGSPLGGYSKDVFVVRLAGEGRPADAVVIRRDLPKGPLEGSVIEEEAVLRAMHRAGIPVAEPLWVETDPRHFGGSALVLRFVEGSPPTDFRANVRPGAVEPQMRQLARILSAIHAVDPRAAGIDEAELAQPLGAHILRLLDRFEAQWRRRREAPNPVIAAGLAWMRANLPGEDPASVIVHGDASLRNLLFDGERPTAMLDWETWHLGDPAEDLAYSRDEVEAAMSWEAFMAEYRAAGGSEVSAERLRFWSLWKNLRGAITSISMLNAVTDRSADLRTAFGGVFFTRHCLTRTAELLLERIEEELTLSAG